MPPAMTSLAFRLFLHSCERDIKNFFKSGNVHFDSSVNSLEDGGRRSLWPHKTQFWALLNGSYDN